MSTPDAIIIGGGQRLSAVAANCSAKPQTIACLMALTRGSPISSVTPAMVFSTLAPWSRHL